MKTKLLIAVLCSLFACSPSNEKLDCWQSSYENMGFDFKGNLDQLENKLHELHLVKGSTKADWIGLISEIQEQQINFEELEKGIEEFVPAEPFYACIGEGKVLQNEDLSTEELKYGVLFSIYHVLSKNNQNISLEIDSSQRIYLSGEEVALEELEDKLGEIINIWKKDKGESEAVVVSLEVSSETKMGLLTDVKEVLRRSAVHHIKFKRK